MYYLPLRAHIAIKPNYVPIPWPGHITDIELIVYSSGGASSVQRNENA